MPMDLVIIRASDVPRVVLDERSILVKAGISGGDIFWETGLGKKAGEELPVGMFVPAAKTSSLYIGMTEKFAKEIGNRLISCLSGQMIITKFPNIAREKLEEYGVTEYTILTAPGKTEGFQFAYPGSEKYPGCNGIIDVTTTEKTADANDIIILEKFYTSTVRMIEAADKISPTDRVILDDFRELIAVALQKRRNVG